MLACCHGQEAADPRPDPTDASHCQASNAGRAECWRDRGGRKEDDERRGRGVLREKLREQTLETGVETGSRLFSLSP